MTINYNIFIWLITIIAFAFLINFIAKKLAQRYMKNPEGQLPKATRIKIKKTYSDINYGIALSAAALTMIAIVFFGVNTRISHKTIKETKTSEIVPPTIIEIKKSNDAAEQEATEKRQLKINVSKKNAQTEYNKFLKDALNQTKEK